MPGQPGLCRETVSGRREGTRCSELQNGLPMPLPFTCIYLSSVCVCTQCHGKSEGLDSLLRPRGLFQDPSGDHQGGGLHFSALSYHVNLTFMAYTGAIHDLLRVAISHIKIPSWLHSSLLPQDPGLSSVHSNFTLIPELTIITLMISVKTFFK